MVFADLVHPCNKLRSIAVNINEFTRAIALLFHGWVGVGSRGCVGGTN